MIPNMNDFIYICDNAYTLTELMLMEVEILSSLQVKLHVPTTHDLVLPMLVELGDAPVEPDGKQYAHLRGWCECLSLIGQAHYPVALHDPAVLARCVGTLAGLLSKSPGRVVQPDGSIAQGKAGERLRDRSCLLQSPSDWECLSELIKGIENAMTERSE